MVQSVGMASFNARYLALLRRFPNRLQEHACLIMPAPSASGVLVFAASHNHHYLLFHDATGFSSGVYEFGMTEDFFNAVGPRHVGPGSPGGDSPLKMALSNGEFRLYQDTENQDLFDGSADGRLVFSWSGTMDDARQQIRDSLDAILYLHQDGNTQEVKQQLSPNYLAEVNFIMEQLTGETQAVPVHRWIRLPDNTLRCMTQFNRVGRGRAQVHALICVDADMVLG